ncbi:MAG: hypothetical protein HMLKMBBP_03557 [Planctomycetes bacterium]|nr:hypothetical protein [Planctomycetota bacterium]
MSLRRVALSDGGEGADSHVVVGWRRDWLGAVREVVVTMDGRVLEPEPARPGRPATVFRTADGRMAGVHVVPFPWLGLRPMVWFDGGYAAGTQSTWLASRRWTAVSSLLLALPLLLLTAYGMFEPGVAPARAAAGAAAAAGALLLLSLGIASLWSVVPGPIWPLLAGGVIAFLAAVIAVGIRAAPAAAMLVIPLSIPAVRHVRMRRILVPSRPPAEPPPPADG